MRPPCNTSDAVAYYLHEVNSPCLFSGMKSLTALIVLCFALTISAVVWAQDDVDPTGPEPAQFSRPDLPQVIFNDNAVSFQRSLYPDYYKEHSASRDLRWVQQSDSALRVFWDSLGTDILALLKDYSGLAWEERQIELHLLRFYPSLGHHDPLVIPMGGMRTGTLTEAAPEGARLEFNLIYQLAQRMLEQASMSRDPFERAIASHPLMQETPYRRDNLALLLTLVTSQQVLGMDSTYDAYQSAFYKDRTPGRIVLEKYLLGEWILSTDRPLSQWIIEEPMGSELVAATRPPRRRRTDTSTRPREYVEGLPLKGELGFSVRAGDNNQIVVDQIDVERLGFACGLREGDVIRNVDGARPRSHKDLVERLLAGLNEGGSTVTITREGSYMTILIQPLDLGYEEDDPYWDGEYEVDLDSLDVPMDDSVDY